MAAETKSSLRFVDVHDSNDDQVPNGGTTGSTTLTLHGAGPAGALVDIWNNGTALGSVTVGENPPWWDITLTGLPLGRYSFTAALSDGVKTPPWVVTIDSSLVLPKPTVVGANEYGFLFPIDVISGVQVVVSYVGMETTDLIRLSWNGNDSLVPPQYGSALGSVRFNLPASVIPPVIGKGVDVMYSVDRNGTPTPSSILRMVVMPGLDPAWGAPKIRQAPDDWRLDVGNLTDDADLYVPIWAYIAAGQRIWLRFEGTRADDSPYHWAHETWHGMPISSANEPHTKVKLSDLQQLKDNSPLLLAFDVSFDGGETTVRFPRRTLIVRTRTLGQGL